ncbi:MAG: PD-(D/E)XK nuclease family protein, partial [Solirubrobacterales bacterium]
AMLAELAEHPVLLPSAAELARLLAALPVPLWAGPGGVPRDRVRLLSPYRLRGRRVRHLFVCGLQDGAFPRTQADSPILSDDDRRLLGLAERAQREDEERYLFAVCLSRPTERLVLSYRATDDDGRAQARSPFVDELRGHLDPPPPAEGEDPLEQALLRERPLTQVTFAPEQAPSARELGRAIALRPKADRPGLLEAVADPDLAQDLTGRIGAAAAAAGSLPGPLTHPAVIAELAARRLYGASTLETHATCSYMRFADHELKAQPLEPKAEPLREGGILHRALELLYRNPPVGSTPRPSTVSRWKERASELLVEVEAADGIETGDGPGLAAHARRDAALRRFCEREARVESPWHPSRLEASFGRGGDDDPGALDLGPLELHGVIDRIDVLGAPGEQMAMVRDYKSGRNVTPGAKFSDDGKLQLPLYMLAVRELWGHQPTGGVYHPLGARTGKDRPRGLVDREATDDLEGEELYSNDLVDSEAIQAAIDGARATAVEIALAVQEGAVTRNPRDNKCPWWCRYAAVCRMERGAGDGGGQDG